MMSDGQHSLSSEYLAVARTLSDCGFGLPNVHMVSFVLAAG